MRLIDADAMMKRLEEWNTSDSTDKALYNFALHRILEQPTIKPDWTELMVICDNCGHAIHVNRMDAQSTNEPEHPETMYYPQVDGITASVIAQPERKTGKWCDTRVAFGGTTVGECSVCKKCAPIGRFCKWCGCEMERGEQNG